ncbi:MAG: hypothetical protein NTX82_03995 [Candidatus Parcubacteria bacterium]|nr:hypothetical protein [Candidatus Parcubacteria bacterium]
MKKTIYVIILAILLMPQMSNAQIVPGQKQALTYCFEIDNLNQYPEQIFIYFQSSSHAQIISDEVCLRYISFHSLAVYSSEIYAVSKAKFNRQEFNNLYNISLPTEMTEEAAHIRAANVMERQNYKNHLADNPDWRRADYRFNYLAFIAKNDSLKEVRDVFNISQFDQTNFKIQNSKVIYTYDNGQVEEKKYQEQGIRPQHSQRPILPWWVSSFWYIIVSVLLVIVIIVSLVIRKIKYKF